MKYTILFYVCRALRIINDFTLPLFVEKEETNEER